MGILQEIVYRKRQFLKDVKTVVPLRDIKTKITYADMPRDFRAAIKRPHDSTVRIIAEIKRASPSKGIIRDNFDVKAIASIYEKKQVHAISVLTEEFFFSGNLAFIPEVRGITSKPVLRKDFIIDPYQIYESRAGEADAILLIAALLEKNQADEYLHIAKELGMSALFEVHDYKDIEMALLLGCDVIGINNRNLDTQQIDLNATFTLCNEMPPGKIVVSESGIRSANDVRKLQEAGIDALLIGTSLMQAVDIGAKIDELAGSL